MHIENIEKIIIINLGDKLFGVNELAIKCNISNSYLREIINMNFGMSPQKLIETFRLERTIKLLCTENKHYNIARMVGYASTRSFRRAFNKRIGMSPSKFKKLIFNSESQSDKVIHNVILGLKKNMR